MRKVTAFLSAVLVLMGASGITMAGVSSNQTVGYEVQAIKELSVSGSPGTLTVSTATAGSQPDPVSNALTTYAITTNGTNKKITGAINTAMPDNVTLKITLAAEPRYRYRTGSTRSGRLRNRQEDGTSKPSPSWNTTTSSRCSRKPVGESRGIREQRYSWVSTPARFALGCGNTASPVNK